MRVGISHGGRSPGAGGSFLLVLAMLGAGCRVQHVQHVQYEADAGQTGYYITCGNEFTRCEAEAKALCPDGYERVSSSRRSKLDTPMMVVKADREYSLDVVCDQPMASKPESSATH